MRGWLLFRSHCNEVEHVELGLGTRVLLKWTFLGVEICVTVLCFAPYPLLRCCALPESFLEPSSFINVFQMWH